MTALLEEPPVEAVEPELADEPDLPEHDPLRVAAERLAAEIRETAARYDAADLRVLAVSGEAVLSYVEWPSFGEQRSEAEVEIDAEVKSRVERGVAALRAYYGNDDWVERIDLGMLQLARVDNCVLGQLFGDYHEGLAALYGSPLYGSPLLGNKPQRDGFTLLGPMADGYRHWNELNAAWREALAR